MGEKSLFGPASHCQSLAELIELQHKIVGDEATSALVAYGMLVTARSYPSGEYFEDIVGILNCLGAAKAELDKAAWHSTPTVRVTAEILSNAQNFVNEMTIPSIEWPTYSEVISCIYSDAIKHAFSGPWRVLIYGSQGQVIGVEELRDF